MSEGDPQMQVRLVWKDDEPRSKRASSRTSGFRIAEWIFLFVGLIAIDVYVWVNTSTVLYQAYQNWSFDQALRGIQPSVPGFVSDEIGLITKDKNKTEVENPELPSKFEPTPSGRPVLPKMLLGRLRIPRLHVTAMVREGADSGTLRSAIGHIPGTALPGSVGNIGLAGHRDTFFRALRNIQADDTIDFETEEGTYHYSVQTTKIVDPSDVSVLTAAGGKTLTLVTCYPFYYVGSAPKRFIVHAVQMGAGTSSPQALTAIRIPPQS